jgi:iron complex transport system substrate-binding protein
MQAIAQLHPDLIITSMYIPPAVKEWADQNSVRLLHVHPTSVRGVYESIVQIGRATGKDKEAVSVVNEMQRLLQTIGNTREPRMRVYTEEWNDPMMIGGNWVPEIVRVAGGIPMIEPGQPSRQVTTDEVLHFDPEVIVLHWCGCGTNSVVTQVKDRKGWSSMRAVSDGKVFVIDDTFLNRPGPRIWKGAQLLSDIFVPTERK